MQAAPPVAAMEAPLVREMDAASPEPEPKYMYASRRLKACELVAAHRLFAPFTNSQVSVQLFNLIHVAIHVALRRPPHLLVQEQEAGEMRLGRPEREFLAGIDDRHPGERPDSPGGLRGTKRLVGGSEFAKTVTSMAGIQLSLEKWLGTGAGRSICSLLCLIYICYQLHTMWGICEEMWGAVHEVIRHLDGMQGDINSIVEQSIMKRGNIATDIIIDKMNTYGLTQTGIDVSGKDFPDFPDLQEELVVFAGEAVLELGDGAAEGIKIWSGDEPGVCGRRSDEATASEDYHRILGGLRDTATILASGQAGLDKLQDTLIKQSTAILKGATSELGGVLTNYAENIEQLSGAVVLEARQQGLQYFRDYWNTYTPGPRLNAQRDKFKHLAMKIIPKEAAGVLNGVVDDVSDWAQVTFINISLQVNIIVEDSTLLLHHLGVTAPALFQLYLLYRGGHANKESIKAALGDLRSELEKLREMLMGKFRDATSKLHRLHAHAPPQEDREKLLWLMLASAIRTLRSNAAEGLSPSDKKDVLDLPVLELPGAPSRRSRSPSRSPRRAEQKRKKKKKKKSKKPKKKQSKKKPKKKPSRGKGRTRRR